MIELNKIRERMQKSKIGDSTNLNVDECFEENVEESRVFTKEPIFIDEEKLQDREMVCVRTNAKKNRVNDEFRAIKHKLVNNAFGAGASSHKNGNLIMISSATANEGKTFCSVNLAFILSLEKNKSVLLVDADVLNPSVNKTLDIDNRPGLIDYLKGDTSNIEDIIYNTSIPNLRIMPAGQSHHLSYELLASDKMLALAQELASRYSDRIVLFDCPPLLGVIETISLSKLVGQVVVVVEHNKTKMASIKEAVSQLDSKLAIGFIMNKSVNNKLSQYGYGYGYGYG
ncbi:XrtA-associated tyrosine autokinase [Vibrio japonicus]|uniref:non-specific protein-tyrosine kinase n=1 Tax=Vibrio japonicus TaxID=1824638 RepID=A0ABY5LNB9_9VIBR|nr:XrtA-associated tyrosine autokinase [Vibrio japonicus]UUM32272.1 XrtA-associated tyrosine autokinase [Vibrio japonicus]